MHETPRVVSVTKNPGRKDNALPPSFQSARPAFTPGSRVTAAGYGTAPFPVFGELVWARYAALGRVRHIHCVVRDMHYLLHGTAGHLWSNISDRNAAENRKNSASARLLAPTAGRQDPQTQGKKEQPEN